MILLLAACAPLIAGGSPAPLPAGQEGEVGFALHGGHVPVPLADGTGQRFQYPTAGGTGYVRWELASGVGLGGRIDIGPTQYLAAGGWIRFAMVRDENSYFGLQLEGGWLYGEVTLPAAFRVSERVWVWLRPGARVAWVPMGMLPAGFTVDMGESWAIHAEAVVMTPLFLDGWRTLNPIGVTGGLGFSSRF